MNTMTLNLLVGFHANHYLRTKSLVSIVTRSNSWGFVFVREVT